MSRRGGTGSVLFGQQLRLRFFRRARLSSPAKHDRGAPPAHRESLAVIEGADRFRAAEGGRAMTKASRVPVIGVLLVGVLCLPAAVSAQQRPAIADKIAKTYGFDSFGQVDAIRYTCNIDLPALKLKISRSWVWEPKTEQVSYEGKDKAGNSVKVTYSRSQLASQSAVVKEEVDPGFFNDQYWLLFPFHLVWDTGAKVEDAGMQKRPLGKGSARKVAVKYSSDGGYTPGDTWELF